jgi:hypothetical protein
MCLASIAALPTSIEEVHLCTINDMFGFGVPELMNALRACESLKQLMICGVCDEEKRKEIRQTFMHVPDLRLVSMGCGHESSSWVVIPFPVAIATELGFLPVAAQ